MTVLRRLIRGRAGQPVGTVCRHVILTGGWVLTALLFTGICQADEPPTTIIHAMSVEGTAPFAVHVHALDSQLGAGSPLNTRYEWNFGDPGGDYNLLEGFNAGHLYAGPGVYELSLRITNRSGLSTESSVSITVHPDTRRRIYVSPEGDDAEDGSGPSSAVRTAGRAFELLSDDATILFRRDGVYPSGSQTLSNRNVHFRAYGSGARPVLHWSGPGTTFASLIALTPNCEDIVIENLAFDSPHSPKNETVRGVSVLGENVTVRRCRFDDVGSAIMAEGAGAHGLLTLDNSSGVIGAYFVWGAGYDQTHLGNTVGGSIDQHNMRFVGDRVLLAHNDLTNQHKSCVWFQIGEYAYLARNKLTDGPAQVGPIPQQGAPEARWVWAVMDANHLIGDSFKVLHGATHVMIRNNICEHDGGRSVELRGRDPILPRTTSHVEVLNNTSINMSTAGKFVEVGPDAENITVANNLYVAPNLATGSSGTANVYVADTDLGGFAKLRNNLWASPEIGWGGGVHYVWPYWSNPSGYKDEQQWEEFAETVSEVYHDFIEGDLDTQYEPQFDAEVGVALPGVFTDFYGTVRPTSGPITAGAVQIPAPTPPPGGGEDTPVPGGGSDDDDEEDPVVVFADDFEEDRGWTVSGIWERGIPAGDGQRGDPLVDADGSGQCYLTGNAPGDSDVDTPANSLTSPVLDATGINPVIRFAVWFHSGAAEDGGDGQQIPEDPLQPDQLEIRLSNDGGATWTFVEQVPPTQGWWIHSLRIGDYLTPTSQIRIRFTAGDLGVPSIVEAALDDFSLWLDEDGLPTARFVNVEEWYVSGSVEPLHLEILDAAPPNPNIVFQTWSHSAESLVATYSDFNPPFAYPAVVLGQVPLGLATVQAIVRNESSEPVEIINRQVFFVEDVPVFGDVDGNGVVDVTDLIDLLQSWGPCPASPEPCPADLDGSLAVDSLDLTILLDILG